jgi:hypothetical protein
MGSLFRHQCLVCRVAHGWRTKAPTKAHGLNQIAKSGQTTNFARRRAGSFLFLRESFPTELCRLQLLGFVAQFPQNFWEVAFFGDFPRQLLQFGLKQPGHRGCATISSFSGRNVCVMLVSL